MGERKDGDRDRSEHIEQEMEAQKHACPTRERGQIIADHANNPEIGRNVSHATKDDQRRFPLLQANVKFCKAGGQASTNLFCRTRGQRAMFWCCLRAGCGPLSSF